MTLSNEFGILEYSEISTGNFYIHKLYIEPQFRKQGHGKELLSKLFSIIKDGNIYLIITDEFNTPVDYLMAWYSKIGFKKETGFIRKNSDSEMKIIISNGRVAK